MADDIVQNAKNSADAITLDPVSSDDPLIWHSTQYSYTPGAGVSASGKRNTLKLSEMQNVILGAAAQRDPEFDQWSNQLYKSGFISKNARGIPAYVADGLANAVEVYQGYVAIGGDKSFTDWFKGYAQTATPPEETGGRYRGPVTTTTVSLTDEVTAEALLDTMARDLLGRGLSQKETQKYLKQFRQAEEAAPAVSTTTPSGDAYRTTVSESAADKGELLRKIIAKNPDYAKYQVDTTIMDMLMTDIKKGQEVIYG